MLTLIVRKPEDLKYFIKNGTGYPFNLCGTPSWNLNENGEVESKNDKEFLDINEIKFT